MFSNIHRVKSKGKKKKNLVHIFEKLKALRYYRNELLKHLRVQDPSSTLFQCYL